MTVTFDEIPARIERPGTYIEVAPLYAALGILPFPSKALILAQKLAGGSATALTPYTITRKEQATAYFGAGSQAETMAFAYLAANQTVPLDVMAVADGDAATAASCTITVGGAATANGTTAIGVAGVRYYAGTASADAPAATAAALVAAVNADPQAVVTAAQGTGENTEVVTLTAKNIGAEGNNIDVVASPAPGDVLPAGMTLTITAMTGGATNPDISDALTAITGEWYTDIAIPWQDSANLSALGAELSRRYNAMVTQDGHAYVAFTGTYSQIVAKIAATNSRFISALVSQKFVSTPWAFAAALMGVAVDKLTSDPSRPMRGFILPNLAGPRPVDRWDDEEEELLLENGGSTFHVSSSGDVTLQKVVTTYLTNPQGVADPAFHEIQEPKVATRIRYDWRAYVELTYPSNKLSDDNSLAAENDPSVVTPSRLKGSWATRMLAYAKAGWVENEVAMARAATFDRNASDRNRVDSSTPYQRIGMMNVLAQQLLFEV